MTNDAHMLNEEKIANAALIVRAVNSHEVMKQALKLAFNHLWAVGANLTGEQYPGEETMFNCLTARQKEVFEAIKKAIAQAEGKYD